MNPQSTAAPSRPGRRHADLIISVVGLLLLLAWDASGWDLAAAHLFGTASGFAWRDAFITSTVLHNGGRAFAWLLLGGQLWAALRPAAPGGPSRAERWRWMGVILLCLLAVPTLKQFSPTSCPWDLAEFGGIARYVSHWHLGVSDGGSGRCFPSGHAVAAFAFFALYFMWHGHDPRRARLWLLTVLGLGLSFGVAQLVRGAHFPSHTAWSAWLCWVICAAAAALLPRSGQRPVALPAN